MSTIRVSNNLDPDQDRHSISPDLGPNCLQWFLADDKRKELKSKSGPVHFHFKGSWVIFSIIIQILIECMVWYFTVCMCPTKRTLGFVCLILFFTSHQQSFSYKGTGLPGLNQY